MVNIIVNEPGKGREVNPYNPFEELDHYGSIQNDWAIFNCNHPEILAFDSNNNPLSVGAYKVDPIWQVKQLADGVWRNIKISKGETVDILIDLGRETRQVYISSIALENKEIKESAVVNVEQELTTIEQTEMVEQMADRYASWYGIYNAPEWNKLRLAYLAGERLGRLKHTTTASSINKQPEKELIFDESDNPNLDIEKVFNQPEKYDTIEQAADKAGDEYYGDQCPEVTGNAFGDGFIAGASHIKASHVSIEEVIKTITEWFGSPLPETLIDSLHLLTKSNH